VVKTAACTGVCKQLRGEAPLEDTAARTGVCKQLRGEATLVEHPRPRTAMKTMRRVVYDLRGEAVRVQPPHMVKRV
jgi:hypothetical protein